MVVDDSALYRAELQGLLNEQRRLRMVAEAECGGQAIAKKRRS